MLSTDPVVQITGQNTFMYDIRLLTFYSFIIDVYRTTVERNCSVIYYINMLVTYFLIQQVREDRRLFPVKISFKSMTDGFMQQNT